MPSLFPIFLTGLLTGGISCMAIQGGLLAAVLAKNLNPNPSAPLTIQKTRSLRASNPTNVTNQTNKHTIRIILLFIAARLIAYTMVGVLLGFMGSFFQFSVTVNIVIQVIATIFMLGVAGNLLNIHPMFRYVIIAPPRFLTRFVRQESRAGQWFVPILVGAMTIFLPCGITQVMMVSAIGSGSPLNGGLILFAFILGTIPLFLLLGVLFQTLTVTFTKYFTKIAAALIILLSLWNIGNIMTLVGIYPNTFVRSATCQFIYCENQGLESTANKQKATTTPVITIQRSSYEIDNPYIPAGEEITLTVKNSAGGGCIQAFTIPKLNVFQIVPVGETRTITFTAPKEKGTLVFSCSMGMYRGKFIVQ